MTCTCGHYRGDTPGRCQTYPVVWSLRQCRFTTANTLYMFSQRFSQGKIVPVETMGQLTGFQRPTHPLDHIFEFDVDEGYWLNKSRLVT